MIETVDKLLIELHNSRNNKIIFDTIIKENLKPYDVGYSIDGVIILGLFNPSKGFPVLICCDNGSLVAANLSDF